ncbi:MAG TPA: XdhC family protein [Anaerolineae bacterium]|nr:XdhC family protein [Anaerolineae bacterium]
MRQLIFTAEAWLAQGERVAVATVVRVIGTAPQPAGARMIASTAGRMAGSVSGGCVEAAVYAEAQAVLAGGAPRLLRFGITEEMIWDVGLACGGTIDVLVQELDPALAGALVREMGAERATALAAVVAGPGGAGETLLLGSGELLAGPADPAVLQALRRQLDRRTPRGTIETLEDGREIFLQVFLPRPALYILGGVHVAIPLTRLARELGFRVVVADPRAKFANADRFPDADEVLVEWPDEALAHLPVGRDTYIVLLTHDPKIDEPALAAALRTDAAYLGAIGSRKTHAGRAARMAKWGITADQLAQVHAPIGLDLGGRTPEETALSIIAEILAVKNGRTGGPLRDSSGPIVGAG